METLETNEDKTEINSLVEETKGNRKEEYWELEEGHGLRDGGEGYELRDGSEGQKKMIKRLMVVVVVLGVVVVWCIGD